MIMRGLHQSTQRKTCPRATLSTQILIEWPGPDRGW
jgi:hypothetical protein